MDRQFWSGIDYEFLEEITNCFVEENYIGRFRFGKIYHGIYDKTIRPLTVKIWDKSMSTNDMTLMREVIFLRNELVKCQPGVIQLLGYVCDGEHLALVYDFKTATTLCSKLHQGRSFFLQQLFDEAVKLLLMKLYGYEAEQFSPLIQLPTLSSE
ncbi:UNVERIFIED_CONTAM: hypothetical protein Sradi_1193200, partial [Sesamum radiatum]